MKLVLAGAQHFHMYHLLDYVQQTGKAVFAGVYDDDEHVLQEISDRYHVPKYGDLDEMLETCRPDVVACFAKPSTRADVIAKCLGAGVSVLADKPPVLNLQELHELKNVVLGMSGPKFTVLLSERYNPPVRTLKRIIDSGEIGDIVNFTAFRPHKLKKSERPDWFFRRKDYAGILVDLAIHDVDVFHWLTGKRVLEVAAHACNFTLPEYPEFEDNGQIIFRADGGVTGLIKVDWLAPSAYPTHGDCRYFLTGTRGTIEVKTGGDIGTTGGTITVCTDTKAPYSVPLDQVENDLYGDFFAAIKDNTEPDISINDVFEAMQVVLAARDAADNNCLISLE